MMYSILIISGILSALPLIIPEFAFISWFALIPFFYILIKYCSGDKFKHRKCYLYGFVWSMGFHLVLYYWFLYLYPMDFLGFDKTQSIAVVLIAWIGISLLQSVQLAFIPLIYSFFCKIKFIRTKKYFTPLILASIWICIEWAQTQTWFGLPWGRLAISQYGSLEMIQSTSILGSFFISLLIVAINGFFTLAILYINLPKKSISYIVISTAILMFNYVYGTISLALYKDDGVPAKVAIVQGNILSGEKWQDDGVSSALKIYKDLTYQSYQKYNPDIIVWTETCIPVTLKLYDSIITQLKQTAIDTQAILLVGAFDTIVKDNIQYDYNAIYTFYPDGSMGEHPYYKRNLVPFGEYLPMKNIINTLLPILSNMNIFEDDLTPGTDTSLIDTPFGKIGGLICFDSIYENLARQSVYDGAGIISLLTNDSWYKDSPAIYQHNGHAVLRAVENRKYIVRGANTGMSSIISPTGKIITTLKPLVSGTIFSEVYFNDCKTIYTYIGNIIVLIAFLFLLLITLISTIFKFRSLYIPHF